MKKRELPDGFLSVSRSLWIDEQTNLRAVEILTAQELHDAIAWTGELLNSPDGAEPSMRARLLLDIECLTDLLDRKLNS